MKNLERIVDTSPATDPSRGANGGPGNRHIVSLQHVSKTYRSDGALIHALKDVSLDVTEGSFAALVGRSGCGKSTLLHLAGGMDFPTSGEVIFDGTATSSLNDDGLTRLRREKVGFVFQSFQLIHTLSVIENVELPLMLAGHAQARRLAGEFLDWVEIGHLAHRMPHKLSGGEMQRTAIARALVHSPRLVLTDEPTGNLDSRTGDVILTLLRRIVTEQHTAILMATHDAEAVALADVIFHMRDGQIEDVVQR